MGKASGNPVNFMIEGEGVASCRKCCCESCQVVNPKRRVCLFCRNERCFDTEVHEGVTTLQPAATSHSQSGWLFNFDELQDANVKRSSEVFATLRDSELDMIEAAHKAGHGPSFP